METLASWIIWYGSKILSTARIVADSLCPSGQREYIITVLILLIVGTIVLTIYLQDRDKHPVVVTLQGVAVVLCSVAYPLIVFLICAILTIAFWVAPAFILGYIVAKIAIFGAHLAEGII